MLLIAKMLTRRGGEMGEENRWDRRRRWEWRTRTLSSDMFICSFQRNICDITRFNSVLLNQWKHGQAEESLIGRTFSKKKKVYAFSVPNFMPVFYITLLTCPQFSFFVHWSLTCGIPRKGSKGARFCWWLVNKRLCQKALSCCLLGWHQRSVSKFSALPVCKASAPSASCLCMRDSCYYVQQSSRIEHSLKDIES